MTQNIIDFLTFKLFISPYLLIICYYLGAITIPFASWFLGLWVKGKFLRIFEQRKEFSLYHKFITESKTSWSLLFISIFMSMEIIWRMMFEFIIAYMQIREALLLLSVA